MKAKIIFIICFFILGVLNAQIINAFAGNGVQACSGDGGPTISSEVFWPTDLITDTAGNLYICDNACSTVRKANINTGIITTIAGTGTSGHSGDGGLAINANLNHPEGITFDKKGNLYIAEEGYIRCVDTAGIITTIAGTGTLGYSGDGGAAVLAQLMNPRHLAFNKRGDLYFTESNVYVIRKIDTNGVISTEVGTGIQGHSGDGGPAVLAQVDTPWGIAFDSKGNLFFSEIGYTNNYIRKIDTSGIISTIAGTGMGGSGGDNGHAISAQLWSPGVIYIDIADNLYICDELNHRIRKISGGVITTIAGKGNPAGSTTTPGYFSGDGGPALLADFAVPRAVTFNYKTCNFYVGDPGNSRIRSISSSNILTTVNSPSVSVCAGTPVTLMAQGSNSYTWSPATGLNTTNGNMVISTSTTSITYSVTASIGSCINTAVVNLTVIPALIINTPGIVCQGENVILHASGASSYTWSTGTIGDVIMINPDSSEIYSVVRNATGCVDTAKVNVTVFSLPKISVTISSDTICIGEGITLSASGANTYTWNTGTNLKDLSIKPNLTQTYTVVGAINTCTSQATALIIVNNSFDISLPNIITPNNDNINDVIDFGKYNFSSLEIKIYDRWGIKVFEGTNVNCIWKPITEDDGTYFYTLDGVLSCNSQKQHKIFKGFITLLK